MSGYDALLIWTIMQLIKSCIISYIKTLLFYISYSQRFAIIYEGKYWVLLFFKLGYFCPVLTLYVII